MQGQPHLLLVYHDHALREKLHYLLNQAGFTHITSALNGADAVERLHAGGIDALITDIPLGRLDGWRLARLVRSGIYPVDAAMPIVVVSKSYSERIADVTAKEYEIDAFIPYAQRQQLPETLRAVLDSGVNVRHKASLLVIEDNADTQRIVERVLNSRFDIELAADGLSGLQAWKARRHDLVLLDVMLPGMSGPDVLQEILALRPAQSVVMMTADAREERAGSLVLAGAADFIAKPFRAEQLRRVCDIAARREDYLRSNEQFALQVAELSREKERALVTLESIADGVITTDVEGRVEYLNPVAERLTGWTNKEAKGRALAEVFRLVNELTMEQTADPAQYCLLEGRQTPMGSHNFLLHKNGGEIAVEDSAAPIRDRHGVVVGVVVVFHDVSEARKLNQQISYQATHDSLTGLINRTEFERRLEHLLEDSRENGSEHVLCYLDLDQFKVVNDTCGHVAGDTLLRQVTEILKQHIRKRDTLARLGGDEFGVLLEYCDLAKAERIAESMRQALMDSRFTWEDSLFTMGVSIGIVPVTADSSDQEDALGMADTACYLAKEAGRNRIHIYHSDDGELVQRHGEMQWVSKVTRAFEEDRFKLFYQSIVPTREVDEGDHYELLIRMLDEQGNVIPPGFFLPAVERYDLATFIDRWVLRTALSWLEDNPDCLQRLQRCSINLSGKSLGDEHFHEFVVDVFAKTRVPPEKICFEITETAAITHLEKAVRFISVCKKLGCYFALDDFGSGMSSFAYLKNLPVDYLKIDGVFIKDMDKDPLDRTMVQSINEVGHVMGLQTIAEFVETQAVMDMLTEMGVDYVQGYHIAIPRPLQEMTQAQAEALPEPGLSVV